MPCSSAPAKLYFDINKRPKARPTEIFSRRAQEVFFFYANTMRRGLSYSAAGLPFLKAIGIIIIKKMLLELLLNFLKKAPQ